MDFMERIIRNKIMEVQLRLANVLSLTNDPMAFKDYYETNKGYLESLNSWLYKYLLRRAK